MFAVERTRERILHAGLVKPAQHVFFSRIGERKAELDTRPDGDAVALIEAVLLDARTVRQKSRCVTPDRSPSIAVPPRARRARACG